MRVLIAGMGKSGIAAAGLALEQGYSVMACDSSPLEALPPDVTTLTQSGLQFHGETNSPSLLDRVDLLILSPGVPRSLPLVREAGVLGVPVIGELEFAFRHSRGRFAAVTGSNGKSTTTNLLGDLLGAHFGDVRVGGNLGTPLSDMLEGAGDGTWHVVEVSSFQLESVENFHPELALLLNVTPDHQDRYDSMKAYADAKGRIFLNQREGDTAVYSADSPDANRMGSSADARRMPFSVTRSLAAGGYLSGENAVRRTAEGGEEILFSAGDMPLPGTHNLENALAAALAARAAGVPVETIREALGSFEGLPHRMELVAEGGGVRAYNDSKATNADAVLKALSAFSSGVILLVGGRDKGADWSVLISEIRRCCTRVIAFGEAGPAAEEALAATGLVYRVDAMGEAVETAAASAREGDTILLSPACASFDEFRNFEERGDRFREAVRDRMRGGTP